MSLFDGLFQAGAAAPSSSLFAPDSKFRRTAAAIGTGVPAAAPAADPVASRKKRKAANAARDGLQGVGTGEPGALGQEPTAAAPKRVKRAAKADAAAVEQKGATAALDVHQEPEASAAPGHEPAGVPNTKGAAHTAEEAVRKPSRMAREVRQAPAAKARSLPDAADPQPRKRRKKAEAAVALQPAAVQQLESGVEAANAELDDTETEDGAAANAEFFAENKARDVVDAEHGADMKAGKGAGELPTRAPRRTPQEEAERLQRTVFVGNLPAAIKAKRVKQTFALCEPLWLHAPLRAFCPQAQGVCGVSAGSNQGQAHQAELHPVRAPWLCLSWTAYRSESSACLLAVHWGICGLPSGLSASSRPPPSALAQYLSSPAMVRPSRRVQKCKILQRVGLSRTEVQQCCQAMEQVKGRCT